MKILIRNEKIHRSFIVIIRIFIFALLKYQTNQRKIQVIQLYKRMTFIYIHGNQEFFHFLIEIFHDCKLKKKKKK